MIAHLSGTVFSKQKRTVVLQVQGVGYRVFVSRVLLEKVREGESLNLHTYTHVREDEFSLYGFPTVKEWELFELLITVSGVGPRSALEIMNVDAHTVKAAIAKKDAGFLKRIPGIGTKTAERIIVDLQSKMKESGLEEAAPGSPDAGAHDAREDIIQALVSLGYKRQHAIQGLKKVPQEVNSDEAIIKYFLQNA